MTESEKVIVRKAESVISLLDKDDKELLNIYVSIKRNEAVSLSKMARNLYICITLINLYFFSVSINSAELSRIAAESEKIKECSEVGYSKIDYQSCSGICISKDEENKKIWKSVYINKEATTNLTNYNENSEIVRSFWNSIYIRYDLSRELYRYNVLSYSISNREICFNSNDSQNLCYEIKNQNDNDISEESFEFQQILPCAYRALRIIDECGG